MQITKKTDINLTKIYINGILHLAFVRSKLVGMDTFKDFERYTIRLTFVGSTSIIVEYDELAKWTDVIKLLEDCLTP